MTYTTYTTYNPDTGEIQGQIMSDNSELLNLNVQNLSWIEGNYDGQIYYIKSNQVKEKPNKPQNALLHFVFDYSAEQWTVDTEQSIHLIRQLRNDSLSVIDRVNPVWYNSLTTEQQQELQSYRQALLDVPQQTGFPVDVVWPAKPHWL